MKKEQIDMLIAAMGKLSEANGLEHILDALLCIEEARALAGTVALELEREMSLMECEENDCCGGGSDGNKN